MELIGFRLRQFPLRGPFYCLECTSNLSKQQGWGAKIGFARQPAIPIIRVGELIRHVNIGGHDPQAFGSSILDEAVIEDDYLVARIEEQLVHLGLRLAPTRPAPVHHRIRCKNCGTRLTDDQ